MDWKELGKELVAKGLPVVGGAVAGPGGAMIGAGVAARLGVAAKPESISAALSDPTIIVRLKELEAEELGLRIADVQHARERNAVAGGRWPYVVDAFVMVMIAALFYALVFVEIPASNRDQVAILFGAILGSYASVIAYHRGSSAGSAAKQDTIDTLMRKR